MKNYIPFDESRQILADHLASVGQELPHQRTIHRWLEELVSRGDIKTYRKNCIFYRRAAVVALAKEKAKKARKK